MKTVRMLTIVVLALAVGVEVAKADFTFGTPNNLGPILNGPDNMWGGCLSRDGLELYFSSNRPGGYGGYDLWVSKRESTRDEWGSPTNLGSPANSPYDECMPCPSADGLTLYFSDGHPPYNNAKLLPGILGGGGDIWKLTRQTRDEPWSAAVNIGPGINSGHALGPSISVDGLSLYFQSHRPGAKGGCDLMVATRTSISDPFANPVFLRTLNSSAADWMPDISPDGLVLFFLSGRPCVGGGTGPYRLWMTTRKSILDPFPPPQVLPPHVNGGGSGQFSGCYDPSLSSDGSTLYFGSDRPGGFGLFDMWQVPIEPVCDLNSDLKIDSADMHIMVDHWGENYALCDIGPTPFGDGVVDIQDFIVLTEHLYRLTAHWKLDELDGSIAYDSVGDYDGTINGNPLWLPVGGMIDGSLMLDGIDDYIDTPFILDPAKEAFSVTAWVSCWTPGQVIISQSNTTGTRGPILGSTWLGIDPSGKLITGFADVNFGTLESESVITDLQWHHVGFVYDTDTFHRLLYVDGVLVAEDTTPIVGSPSNGGLYIGASKDLGAGTLFSGFIDDVRIYNQALTTKEIAALAQ